MGINFDKQFYKVENTYNDVEELHDLFCSNRSRVNRNLLLLKINELQRDISYYKASLKNIYIRDDKIGKNQ
jgi:hypothetical protein